MEIILLGTGGPKPDPHRQGPSLAIRISNTCLLFDAGRGVSTQLVRAGIALQDVSSVFITHHHFDHIGGLGDFILSGWNVGRQKTLALFGPHGTQEIVNLLLDGIYKSDIAFRQREALISGAPLADIVQMVTPVDITPGLVFADQGIKVFCDFVQHGHGLGISENEWQCLAYRVEAHDKSVTISGDAIDCSGLETLAKNADVMVICCYLSRTEMRDREGELIGKYILACAPQVGKIAARAKISKLILTHIREKSDVLMAEVVADISATYDGDIVVGRDLMKIRV